MVFDILVFSVILKDDKVLMVKETSKDVEGLLNFPAGHLEKNETLIEGAIREIKEETGLEAKIISLVDTQYFSRKEKNYVAFVFQWKLIENSHSNDNELFFDFYDIEYLKNNKSILRKEKVIITALNKINTDNNKIIDILDSK